MYMRAARLRFISFNLWQKKTTSLFKVYVFLIALSKGPVFKALLMFFECNMISRRKRQRRKRQPERKKGEATNATVTIIMKVKKNPNLYAF